MKTTAFLLTTVLIALCFETLDAQTQQGNFIIGDLYKPGKVGVYNLTPMNLGFGTRTTKSDDSEDTSPNKYLNLNLMPKAGYFVVDNLVLGIDLSLLVLRQTDGDWKYIENMLGAGPFVRYYVPLERVLPFFELNGSFGRANSRYVSDSNDIERKRSVNSLGGGAGVAIMLGRKVSFDLLAGYSRMVLKDLEENDENLRDIYGSVGLKLGFTIILGQESE